MPDLGPQIGARLREERGRLGINQPDAAEAGGVKTRAQVYYEQGQRAPDAIYLALVAQAGMDVGYILTGERKGSPAGGIALTADEAALLACWRELAGPQRDAVGVILRGLCPTATNQAA